jgi:hypothetical protein
VGAVHNLGFWGNRRVLRTLLSGGSSGDVVHISGTDAALVWARCTFIVHGKFDDDPV